MSDYEILAGSTSQRVSVWLADSSSTVGAGLASLVFNSASLSCYYWREDEGNAGATLVTLATATRGTFTSSGFIEKDGTNLPGAYEFGIPNAAIAAGAKWVRIMFKGATNLAQRTFVIRLLAINLDDAVRAGLTALPNATAGANTGLPVVGTQVPNATAGAANGLFIAGTNAATTVTTSFTTTFTGNLTGSVASVTGAVGSVTGLTASNLDVAVSTRMATYTQPTGFLAATFPGSVASPTNITAGVITTVTNLTNAPTSGDFTAVMKTSLNAATPVATLSGDFSATMKTSLNASTPASITGAVGSVAGNVVGSVGSVLGAVGSVTGAVGSVTGNVGGNVIGSVASVTAGVTVTTNNDKTGYRLDATGSAALTESYAADGAAATLPQLLYMTLAMLSEFSITGTTLTAKRLDGSTIAGTFTLNDSVSPTGITRAT